MLKWFWPGVTWTVALTALALWFGADRVEADIAERTSQALESYAWTSFDVDGRDVVVKGMAPDPEAQNAAVASLKQVSGIRDLSDLTTVLELASPYVFKVVKDEDGMSLSGFIPDNSMRDRIMSAAEAAMPGGMVDDQLALGRGSSPDFEKGALLTLELVAKLNDAEIEISDQRISVKGKALDEGAYQALEAQMGKTLPYGLQIGQISLIRP